MSKALDDIAWHLKELGRLLGELRIEELPGVPVDSVDFANGLPCATAAVYFLRSREQGLLYIGRATNLRSRLMPVWWWNKLNDCGEIWWDQTHAKVRPSLDLADVVLYWWAVPREMLATVESLLLQAHKPPWNNHRG